jgi:gamma-glutamyltranspeptidase/glutathione hydrolase
MTHSETIYLTVADAQGNMVSFINSLYDAFGSALWCRAPGSRSRIGDRVSPSNRDFPTRWAPRNCPFTL